MKVVLDYHLVSRNPNSGMGVYVKEVARGLEKTRGNKIVLLDFKTDYPKSFVGKVAVIFKEQIWVQLIVPKKISNSEVDVSYFPNPPIPLFQIKPTVLTIPDISFYYDKSFGFFVKLYLLIVYFLSAHRASFITTFSNNSKKDIVKVLRINENKIRIITPALKREFVRLAKSKTNRSIPEEFNIKGKYILAVPGTYIPRKNMEDLVRAFKLLPKSLRSEYKIVSVGKTDDNHFKSFLKFCNVQNFGEDIIFLSRISERELVGLYKRAQMFVYPSLYEGFGLPPLEAMACGTPVIVYDNSSLPEVVGDSALIVVGASELSIAISKLSNDRMLRQGLVKSGYSLVKKFTWERTVSDLNLTLGEV